MAYLNSALWQLSTSTPKTTMSADQVSKAMYKKDGNYYVDVEGKPVAVQDLNITDKYNVNDKDIVGAVVKPAGAKHSFFSTKYGQIQDFLIEPSTKDSTISTDIDKIKAASKTEVDKRNASLAPKAPTQTDLAIKSPEQTTKSEGTITQQSFTPPAPPVVQPEQAAKPIDSKTALDELANKDVQSAISPQQAARNEDVKSLETALAKLKAAEPSSTDEVNWKRWNERQAQLQDEIRVAKHVASNPSISEYDAAKAVATGTLQPIPPPPPDGQTQVAPKDNQQVADDKVALTSLYKNMPRRWQYPTEDEYNKAYESWEQNYIIANKNLQNHQAMADGTAVNQKQEVPQTEPKQDIEYSDIAETSIVNGRQVYKLKNQQSVWADQVNIKNQPATQTDKVGTTVQGEAKDTERHGLSYLSEYLAKPNELIDTKNLSPVTNVSNVNDVANVLKEKAGPESDVSKGMKEKIEATGSPMHTNDNIKGYLDSVSGFTVEPDKDVKDMYTDLTELAKKNDFSTDKTFGHNGVLDLILTAHPNLTTEELQKMLWEDKTLTNDGNSVMMTAIAKAVVNGDKDATQLLVKIGGEKASLAIGGYQTFLRGIKTANEATTDTPGAGVDDMAKGAAILMPLMSASTIAVTPLGAAGAATLLITGAAELLDKYAGTHIGAYNALQKNAQHLIEYIKNPGKLADKLWGAGKTGKVYDEWAYMLKQMGFKDTDPHDSNLNAVLEKYPEVAGFKDAAVAIATGWANKMGWKENPTDFAGTLLSALAKSGVSDANGRAFLLAYVNKIYEATTKEQAPPSTELDSNGNPVVDSSGGSGAGAVETLDNVTTSNNVTSGGDTSTSALTNAQTTLLDSLSKTVNMQREVMASMKDWISNPERIPNSLKVDYAQLDKDLNSVYDNYITRVDSLYGKQAQTIKDLASSIYATETAPFQVQIAQKRKELEDTLKDGAITESMYQRGIEQLDDWERKSTNDLANYRNSGVYKAVLSLADKYDSAKNTAAYSLYQQNSKLAIASAGEAQTLATNFINTIMGQQATGTLASYILGSEGISLQQKQLDLQEQQLNDWWKSALAGALGTVAGTFSGIKLAKII